MGKLNDIINEQRERIAELEQSQVPNGYIAVPADAWHELCQQEQRAEAAEKRLAEVERERGEIYDIFTNEDGDYLFEPLTPQNIFRWINENDIEQQIKGVEDAIKYSDDNANFVDAAGLEDYLGSQLRQQLSGGE